MLKLKAAPAAQAVLDAIETVLPWSEFERSGSEAVQLAQPHTFDHLHLIGEHIA